MANENGGKPRLRRHYEETIRPKLQQEFGFGSPMQIPRLEKIVVNVGMGEANKNPKLLDAVVAEMAQITGQRPVVTKSKRAISNFALREGQPVGASVTLRRERMWEFLDRLINVAMPRIRDFRGVSTRAFDGRGNYTMGVKEQLIFPEIDYDKVEKIHGMDITIVTSTTQDDQALALLRELGMPFRGEPPVQVNAAAA
jgi:large subunit ribosomal protein L5